MEDQILNKEYRAKYVSADKYRDIVQKLTLIRKERAQLAKAYEELKDETERAAMEAVMRERRRAEVHLTASLSQKNEEYIAVTEKYESELRSASNKHSEQLEKAMHESFIQTKFLEEKIEALKRANINLERESRAEMEHYKQENQSLLDQLETEASLHSTLVFHYGVAAMRERESDEARFEELQLLRNVHTEKEKEIDKLKRQIVELQEQVALTEKLNEYHNERFEQHEMEGRRQLEKELHQSSVERRKLEERHAGDIQERERKLEELLRNREEALKEAKMKEELLKLKVREHEGAMQEIEQLRREYQSKSYLQVHFDELKSECDRMHEELRVEKNKASSLKKDNKQLESQLEDANEQVEEKVYLVDAQSPRAFFEI
ncbi:hypothetical protein FOL47_001446 [Perkinsus chesapeaki]|uniref:Uncharacterized protein n=1 Tax=Perkinsus chesapeaki TaxID=330153 RepID=A0A7J6MJB2_PERCH|nr:hypothetical protein FOL47_001446 [Perkinsus chesapeaki]